MWFNRNKQGTSQSYKADSLFETYVSNSSISSEIITDSIHLLNTFGNATTSENINIPQYVWLNQLNYKNIF